MTEKQEKRLYEGLITELFPDDMFRVCLDNDDKVDNDHQGRKTTDDQAINNFLDKLGGGEINKAADPLD